MSESKSGSYGGIGLGGALFVLFLGLRLTDHIDWAWYWVAAPLWIPLAFALLLVTGVAIALTVGERRARKKIKAAIDKARKHREPANLLNFRDRESDSRFS